MIRWRFLAVTWAIWTGGFLPCLAQDVPGVHPGYDLIDLLPSGFTDGIGGMDFLPDGSLAVCTWGGIKKNLGKVFILGGTGGSGSAGVTFRQIAATLNEPLGLKVMGQEIYFMQKQELSKLAPKADGSYALSTVYTGYFYEPGQYHQFATGLEHVAGSFYFTATSSHAPKLESGERGAFLRLDPVAKTREVIANGLREPNGLVRGPDGEFFTTDNQGEWRPSSMLVHLKRGRFFGMHGTSAPVAAGRSVSPPAVWLPHGETSRSPSQPILVPNGQFQGQLLMGDVAHGGLKRIFLEKVKGEYQGAIFYFSGTAGFSCGWNRLSWGPDGALYLGGVGGSSTLGNPGGWNWSDKTYGLQKLKPNGKTAFEMLAVRSRANGFEIEFTKPVAAGSAAADKFALQGWWYNPTSAYGGSKVGVANVNVKSVRLSPDGRKITLEVEPFAPLKVYGLKLTGVTSATGESLWGAQAWYTLLNAAPADAPTHLADTRPTGAENLPPPFRTADGGFIVRLSESGGRDWALMGADGVRLASGRAAGNTLILPRRPGQGVAYLLLRSPAGRWIRRAVIPYP